MELQSFGQEIEIVSAKVSCSLFQVRLKLRLQGLVLVDCISIFIRYPGSLFTSKPQQGASSVTCLCFLYVEIPSALVISGSLEQEMGPSTDHFWHAFQARLLGRTATELRLELAAQQCSRNIQLSTDKQNFADKQSSKETQ